MIFFDTETTGLLRPEENELALQPHIIELYAVKLDWNADTKEFVFIDEFSELIKPPIAISQEITDINHITNEMVANALTFPDLYPRLCRFFLGEHTSVAHNHAFDSGMLWVELARMEKEFKFPWPMNQICTVETTFHLENKKQSLAKLHTLLFGFPHDNAHRAQGDVQALVSIYRELLTRGYI